MENPACGNALESSCGTLNVIISTWRVGVICLLKKIMSLLWTQITQQIKVIPSAYGGMNRGVRGAEGGHKLLSGPIFSLTAPGSGGGGGSERSSCFSTPQLKDTRQAGNEWCVYILNIPHFRLTHSTARRGEKCNLSYFWLH